MEKDQIPDGGYGWVIAIAFASNNVIIIPIMQSFGLLFRHVFRELQMDATDVSTIINVNSAFGLLLGFINGPILKKFGYRKVAMTGTVIMFIGLVLTSTAASFKEFIIYYGIINSIGFSVSLASFSLALNTYFNKRRNLASGLCSAITGLGPVFMPVLISFLIGVYGVRGTTLILAGLILNSLPGSLLLHPVSWHYRKVSEKDALEKELELLNPTQTHKGLIPKTEEKDEDESEENLDIHLVHGLEKVMIPSKPLENEKALILFRFVRFSLEDREESKEAGRGPFASQISLHEKAPDATWWRKSSNAGIPHHTSQCSIRQQKKSKKTSQKWTSKMVKLFDLDLLQDHGYRVIWIGMSLAFTGEINFSLMTPMILDDKGWDVLETAKLMSSLAFADILMRFISPFIGDALKLPAKQMYMISLAFLVITRSSLTFVHEWNQTLISCILIGVSKGLRTVYMALVIPSYVPLDKLASASGLQTVLNGIFLMLIGPILGYIRDKSGSYNLCIHVINALSLITITFWGLDMIFSRKRAMTADNQKNPQES